MPKRRVGRALTLLLMAWVPGCATGALGTVGPDDVAPLREQAVRRPSDGPLRLRLAAALAAADRCDEAMAEAREGARLSPADPLGALVRGECLERSGAFAEALETYAGFLRTHPDAPGAAAVEGRRSIALRAQARVEARRALASEATRVPGEPDALGVLPFAVDASPEYQALSAGLAHMLVSDLALLGRFPLVERVRLDVLLDEMALGAQGRVDPATAARAGRLVGASRLLAGTLSLPGGDAARLAGALVLDTGELLEPVDADGAFRDLLDLEKTYALQVAEGLGYVLSQAERQRVLDNRPRSLTAFLAFSRGLDAEDRGAFDEAARHYADAVRADPGYEAASDGLQRAAGAAVLTDAGPGAVAVDVAAQVDRTLVALQGPNPVIEALGASVLDIASHQPERATLDAGWASSLGDTLPSDVDPLPVLIAVISVSIRIPR